MPIQSSDFLVVNRGGIDYKTPASDLGSIINTSVGNGILTIKDDQGTVLGTFKANQAGNTIIAISGGSGGGSWDDLTDKPTIGDGTLNINNADGTSAGVFTANQEATTTVTLPAGFNGSWNDLDDKPTIGDGAFVINDSSGAALATFTANQVGDTSLNLPAGFSGSWNDLTDKPTVFPPDNSQVAIALDDLTDVTAAGNPGDYLTKAADGSHAFTAPTVPPALQPKGYIDVASAAPASPVYGDLYQQKSAASNDSEVATATWSGIVGETTLEGQYILFATDDLWHLSGNSTPTQVQSDWNNTDSGSAAFIANKPDINDGTLTINDSDNNEVATFTANQSGDTTFSLPAGFSGDYDDLINKPAINDGVLTIKASDNTTTVASFTANQAGNSSFSLPVVGDGTLTVKDESGAAVSTFTANQTGDSEFTLPTVNAGVLTVKNADGSVQETFSANQLGAKEVVLPLGFSGIYDDLANKPTIGDGILTINDSDGTQVATFTANTEDNVIVALPAGFSGSWNDLADKPTEFPAEPIALDDLSDVVAAGNEGDVLVKKADGSHHFVAPIDIPSAINAKGVVDVELAAAAQTDPVAAGDLYIQHKTDNSGNDVVAEATWTGIEGVTVREGQYVLYGTDSKWHIAGQTDTDITVHYYQETEPTQPQKGEYWFNPLTDVYAVYRENAWLQLNGGSSGGGGSEPGAGLLEILDSNGATVGTFSANQATGDDVAITLPHVIEEAPGDDNLYTRKGADNSWARGLPYDISTLPALS